MTGRKPGTYQIRNSTAEFLIFTAQSGEEGIEVRYEDETIWLTQRQIAALFDVTVPTINEHLKHIYAQGELIRGATVRKFRIVQMEGAREVAREVDFYNLDAIISTGYRVNSVRATQFRQWATQVLRDFAIYNHTAAELIMQRADSTRAHMGLTTWENSPDGKILKSDVAVAKNYLAADELESLGRIVNAYLELAEDRARRRIPMTMEDWSKRLDRFLEFDERDILQHSGKVTAAAAQDFAASEKALNLLHQQLDALKKRKRGLMQKLLTGKWRVGDGQARRPAPTGVWEPGAPFGDEL